MQRVSEFLAEIDPHGVYDSASMKRDFEAHTGRKATWPEATEQETRKAMQDRGLGGTLGPAGGRPLCWGWAVAEHLAATLVPGGFRPLKVGRGSRFWEAVAALRRAGQ